MTRVFISSTSDDLQIYRDRAQDVILRQDMTPVGMSRFDAGDESPLQQIQRQLATCDVCVCIVGFRYGSKPPDSEYSFTHHEFLFAGEQNIPRVVLMMDVRHATTPESLDRGASSQAIEDFRQILLRDHSVGLFNDAGEFTITLFTSLKRFKTISSPIYADSFQVPVKAPDVYVEHRYSLLLPTDCIGRNKELAELTGWAEDESVDTANVFLIEAMGGMGKSAFTWKWFNEHAVQFDAQIWWSFYAPNSSFDRFMRCAVAYLGLCDDPGSLKPEDLERLFLNGLASRRCLIVFDGLERVLRAYSRLDAPYMDDEHVSRTELSHYDRSLSDPRCARVLQSMLGLPRLKLLITTRMTPVDFEHHGELLPNIKALELPGLSKADCQALFDHLGCSGDRDHFLKSCASLSYYTIAIRAILGQVQQHRSAPRDYDAWRQSEPDFDPFAIPEVDRKQAMIVIALKNLSPAQRRTIGLLAAFRIPVHYSILSTILVSPYVAFSSEESLCQGLQVLEDCVLVGWDKISNSYDLHPVIRRIVVEYFGQLGMQVILQSLDDFFNHLPVNQAAGTQSDTTLSIERFNTLLGLGRPDAAWQYYSAELVGKLQTQAGNSRLVASHLEAFFPNGIDSQSNIENDEGLTFRLAEAYSLAGQLKKAETLFDRCDAKLSQYSLSSIHQQQLRLAEAEDAARRSILLQSGGYDIGLGLQRIASLRRLIGRYDDCMTLLDSSEHLLDKSQNPESKSSGRGRLNTLAHILTVRNMRARCLLDRGSVEQAQTEIQSAIQIADEHDLLVSLADTRATAATIALESKDVSMARDFASLALFAAREMSRPQLEGRSLLTLAQVEAGNDPQQALDYIDALQFVEGHAELIMLSFVAAMDRARYLLMLNKEQQAYEAFVSGQQILASTACKSWPVQLADSYQDLLRHFKHSATLYSHALQDNKELLEQLRVSGLEMIDIKLINALE